MEAGSVFYTKDVSIGVGEKSSVRYKLKTPAVALMLGTMKDPKKRPTRKELDQILCGRLGLVRLDDVEECLDKKTCDKLVKFLEKKYK